MILIDLDQDWVQWQACLMMRSLKYEPIDCVSE
jgi:hypothetical protein